MASHTGIAHAMVQFSGAKLSDFFNDVFFCCCPKETQSMERTAAERSIKISELVKTFESDNICMLTFNANST